MVSDALPSPLSPEFSRAKHTSPRRRCVQVKITKESLAPSLPKPWTTFSFRNRTGLVEESKCAELCDRFAKVLPVPGAADSLELDQPCTIHLRSEERRVGKECRSR